MEIPPQQKLVLIALSQCHDMDFCFMSFAIIMNKTGLGHRQVRRACRALKRKGLAAFANGLWREDGTPGGSGYGITPLGVTYIP